MWWKLLDVSGTEPPVCKSVFNFGFTVINLLSRLQLLLARGWGGGVTMCIVYLIVTYCERQHWWFPWIFRFVQELWLEYLELYSSQSNRDELREICDQAVEFSPTYSVWWKYLEYSQTYHDKRTVCLRLISFLTGNPSDVVELEFHSHCILETLLYLIQLELYSGHYKSALAVFKAAIAKKPGSCTEVPELSNHLLPSDFCFAWLAYIHVFEFHRLPAAWFDPRHGKPSRMVTKEDFVFPWKPSQQSRTSGEKLLVMFQGKDSALYFLSFLFGLREGLTVTVTITLFGPN